MGEGVSRLKRSVCQRYVYTRQCIVSKTIIHIMSAVTTTPYTGGRGKCIKCTTEKYWAAITRIIITTIHATRYRSLYRV